MNSNPIQSVDGAAVACPSAYVYKLEDSSPSIAGRTDDTMMHKLRNGQEIALELTWRNIPTEVGSQVIKAFNPEYINVEYLDLLIGDYVTKRFYVGNRSAPMYNAELGLWESISFKIIIRSGQEYDKTTNTWVDLGSEVENE